MLWCAMAALTVLPARCAGAAAADFLLLHSASSGWASIWSAFSASALGLEPDCWPFRDVRACLVWVLHKWIPALVPCAPR